jgi:type IV pilus assembly protein PilV
MIGDMKMRTIRTTSERQRGVMLIEALLAILIFSIGILAVVGMQGIAIKNVGESKIRNDANFLAGELLSQMWADNGNITTGNYNYAGSGGAPGRIAPWVARVTGKMPGGLGPIVTLTNPSAQGASVQITIRWQLPEEANLNPPPPPHSYTVLAAVYTS